MKIAIVIFDLYRQIVSINMKISLVVLDTHRVVVAIYLEICDIADYAYGIVFSIDLMVFIIEYNLYILRVLDDGALFNLFPCNQVFSHEEAPLISFTVNSEKYRLRRSAV